MMAHEGEANNANGLKYSGLDDGETCSGITLEQFRCKWALVYDGEDDDEHATKGERRGDAEFVNIAVER